MTLNFEYAEALIEDIRMIHRDCPEHASRCARIIHELIPIRDQLAERERTKCVTGKAVRLQPGEEP